MGTCGKPKIIPKVGEKNFSDKIDYFKENNIIQLKLRLLNVKKNISCQIKLNIFTNKEKTKYKEIETTKKGTLNKEKEVMIFKKVFVLEFFFEKEQFIEFEIIGNITAKIQTSLHNIMGSRDQTLKKIIEDKDEIYFEVKAISVEKELISILNINIYVEGDLSGKAILYEIDKKENNKKENLYKSEGIRGNIIEKKIKFKLLRLPDIFICDKENKEKSQICISFHDILNGKYLGKCEESLSSLINQNKIVQLKQNLIANIKINSITNYSFLDYIRGGMEINLTVAIDFTLSNGSPKKKSSLHYLSAKKTIYEKAIKSCGDIVGHFDFDQKFPAYGFGGKFFGEPEVSHCFPLNRNPNDPEIKGIDGILKAYRDTLDNTELDGPTYFHFIINNLNEKVKKEQKKGKDKYNILMILTDGIIDDMSETIDSLVESSFLPISVIIIGIGKADFSNMVKLDADDDPLYDKNDRKADRDLVQFVPFINFQNDGQKLAEQVLEEVPRQIVEYYQLKNKKPKAPIINIKMD